MTIASLLLGTIAGQILFVLTKIFFINSLNMESWTVTILYYLALTIITIAVSRRMGTLNYFEDIFLIVVWLIVSLIVDFVITTSVTGKDVYTTSYFWISYLVISVSLLLFHKKVHVEVRKANAQ